MKDVQFKSVVFESAQFKMTDEGNGTIEGYFSVFGNYDSANEAVMPGAFKKTIPQFLEYGFLAKAHNWDEEIGTPVNAFEDSYGLYIKFEYHSTDDAQRARTKAKERLARGKRVKFSIGYKVLDAKPGKNGGTDLYELHLFEGSDVTAPANILAGATAVKSLNTSNLAQSITFSGLNAIHDRLWWNLYENLYDNNKTVEEITAELATSFDDYKTISINLITAVMNGLALESRENTAKSIKSILDRRNSVEYKSLDGLTVQQESDMVLATITRFKNRLNDISEIRTKAGRTLSASTRELFEGNLSELKGVPDVISQVITNLETFLKEADNSTEMVKSLPTPEQLEAEFLQLESEIIGVF